MQLPKLIGCRTQPKSKQIMQFFDSLPTVYGASALSSHFLSKHGELKTDFS